MSVRLTPRRSAFAVLAAAVVALVAGALRQPANPVSHVFAVFVRIRHTAWGTSQPRPSPRALARSLARREALAHLRMAASRLGDALGRRTA
jgi:hypothetical protein